LLLLASVFSVNLVNAQLTAYTANTPTITINTVTGTIKLDSELSSSESDVDTFMTWDDSNEKLTISYETNMKIYNPVINLVQSSIKGKSDPLIANEFIWNGSTWDNTADSTNWDIEAMGSLQKDSQGYYLSWNWDVNEDTGTATNAETSIFQADDNVDSTVDGYSFDDNDFVYIVATPDFDPKQNSTLYKNKIDIVLYLGYGASSTYVMISFNAGSGTDETSISDTDEALNYFNADGKSYVFCFNLLNMLNIRTGGSYTSGVIDKVRVQRYLDTIGTEPIKNSVNTTNDGASLILRQFCILESEDPDGFHLIESNFDAQNDETYDIITNDTDGTVALSLDDTTKSLTELNNLNAEFHYLTLSDGIAEWSFSGREWESVDRDALVATALDSFDIKDSSEEPLSYSGTYYVNYTSISSDYEIQQIWLDDDEVFQSDGDLDSGFTLQDKDTSFNELSDLYTNDIDGEIRITPATSITASNQLSDADSLSPLGFFAMISRSISSFWDNLPEWARWILGIGFIIFAPLLVLALLTRSKLERKLLGRNIGK